MSFIYRHRKRQGKNTENITLNGAAGESEGVAYMLDGERTSELERFIKNE
ncbi:hypothetical protein [Bacillus infantis]|nr:hypothetical protein [Bacillus infantis]